LKLFHLIDSVVRRLIVDDESQMEINDTTGSPIFQKRISLFGLDKEVKGDKPHQFLSPPIPTILAKMNKAAPKIKISNDHEFNKTLDDSIVNQKKSSSVATMTNNVDKTKKNRSWLPILIISITLILASYYYMNSHFNDDIKYSLNEVSTISKDRIFIPLLNFLFEVLGLIFKLLFYIVELLYGLCLMIPTKSMPQQFQIIKEENNNNKDLITDTLNSIKEKIIQENRQYFLNVEQKDFQLFRQELDKEFNKTFEMFASQFSEKLKPDNQLKNEIEEMKRVIKSMQERYESVLADLNNNKNQIKNEDTTNKNDLASIQNYENEFLKKIEAYINRTFYIYNADKTASADFASELVGGQILFTECTQNYDGNAKWFTMFGLPIKKVIISPRVVIQGAVEPGNCWSFKGQSADLYIQLAARIIPTSFSIEHIPKELSITGDLDSAPRNVTIYVNFKISNLTY
jgi:hypothetical protein